MRILILLLLTPLLFADQSRTKRIDWNQSVEQFADLEVEVLLSGGKQLRGTWVAISGNQFTIKTKRGNESAYRTEIQSLRASKKRVRGRVLGAVGGYLLGAGLITAITGSAEGAQGLPGLLMPALAGLGYWIGKEADRDQRNFEFN